MLTQLIGGVEHVTLTATAKRISENPAISKKLCHPYPRLSSTRHSGACIAPAQLATGALAIILLLFQPPRITHSSSVPNRAMTTQQTHVYFRGLTGPIVSTQVTGLEIIGKRRPATISEY
jgi:hypothetical protein